MRWLLICVLGGLIGGMLIHRKYQRHKLKIIPLELHRRIQAFGTLGTHYATVVGGPAIEYGSHGQCQVTGGDEGLPPWVDGKTRISSDEEMQRVEVVEREHKT